jgi:hypothetical protein
MQAANNMNNMGITMLVMRVSICSSWKTKSLELVKLHL